MLHANVIPEKINTLPKDRHIEKASLYHEEAKSLEENNPSLALSYYLNAIAECELALHDKKKIKEIANIVQSTLVAVVELDSKNPDVLSEFKNNDILRKARVALTILGLNEQVRNLIPVLNRTDKVTSEKFDVLRQKMANVSIALFNKKQHETVSEKKSSTSRDATPLPKEQSPASGLFIKVTPLQQSPIVQIPTPKINPQIETKPIVDNASEKETLTVAVVPKVESPVIEAKETRPALETSLADDDSFIEVELDLNDIPSATGVVTFPEEQTPSESINYPDPKPKTESNLSQHSMFRPSSTIIAASLVGAIGSSLYTAGLAAPVIGAVVGGLVGYGSEKAADHCSLKRPKQG